MLRVSPAIIKTELPGCHLASSCETAGNGGCKGFTIETEDREQFELARRNGLNPTIRGAGFREERMGHTGRIEVCDGMAQDFDTVQKIERVFGKVVIRDETVIAGHLEADAVRKGEVDIEDIKTDQGFAMLDRITSGSTPRYADHHELALQNDGIQVLPIYNI